ncbi:3-phosphoshikimate 1-carboxyvinyltransferase [Pseudoflavonifractor capillosus]|uniref:3-phosphoshikimate 1-carboxyvinyltransferase n=1 Tax=Pseudoflavonifractor capillosus TaxID=106588 RepID=UPI00195DBEA4|nr:3-phosphoshikimate 1-carboxyvinyltransferase [Pseudoflavonifractor capillosus]MBM6681880.1 3-phosphoshikimate 1-carboxyvinyltransferase [Pseudoflavonifractor capillosus]
MDVTIIPSRLRGTVTPPSSKSVAHRALIAAALSGGFSIISNLGDSKDIQATRRCLSNLSTWIEDLSPDKVRVHGIGHSLVQAGPFPMLDCGESGSTLRFLIPVALLVQGEAQFTGRGRLMERPLKPYEDLFREKGLTWKLEDSVLTLDGGRGYDTLALDPGEYRLPGNVSSQFITGLLFVLPLLDGDSDLVLTSPLESRGYVDLTLDVLRTFGIRVEERADAFHVPGNQCYESRNFTVEADWSQAAFWYAANFAGGQVDIQGLNMDSKQGDKVIALQYWKLAKPGEAELDVSQCPDLVPPLAAMAAVRAGTTHFTHAARLRMKESDRLSTVAAALQAMGAQVEEGADSLTIHGQERLPGGGTVDCCNDHRIAMMAAVSAAFAQEPVKLLGAECVRKSYPEFWDHFIQLGGEVRGLVLR